MTPSPMNRLAGCAFRTRCVRATAVCETEPMLTEPGPGRGLRCFHPMPLPEAA